MDGQRAAIHDRRLVTGEPPVANCEARRMMTKHWPANGEIASFLAHWGISDVARVRAETSSTISEPSTREGTPMGLQPPLSPIDGTEIVDPQCRQTTFWPSCR